MLQTGLVNDDESFQGMPTTTSAEETLATSQTNPGKALPRLAATVRSGQAPMTVATANTDDQGAMDVDERGGTSDFCWDLDKGLNAKEPGSGDALAPSAYQLFCRDKRREHKEEGHATHLDVKKLRAMWEGLNDEERKPWVQTHAEQVRWRTRSACTLPFIGHRIRVLERADGLAGSGAHGDVRGRRRDPDARHAPDKCGGLVPDTAATCQDPECGQPCGYFHVE